MMMISSLAGRRLARAKAEIDRIESTVLNGVHVKECEQAVEEYEAAADAVANELIAHRFHEMDGED